MDERRTLRVSEAVREELSEIIGFEMEDPRLLAVEVDRRQVSPDGRHADVKVATPRRRAASRSKRWPPWSTPRHYLRHELARRLSLRQVPELHFEPGSRSRTSRAGSNSCSSGRKNLVVATEKLALKSKQFVVVLFLLAAFVRRCPAAIRRSFCGSKRAPTPWDRPIRSSCTGTTGSRWRRPPTRPSTKSGGSTNAFELQPGSEWSQVNRHAAEQARQGFAGVVPAAGRLRGIQPAERRGVRYHGRAADEGWGFYKGIGPPAASGGSSRRR